MSVAKVLGIGSTVVLIAGCQSWQYRHIDSLPSPASIPQQSEPGKVDVWYFDGISGNFVDAMVNSALYPDAPDEITSLTELSRPESRANNYGTLIRGYIEPPATGEYTFYVSGDDQTQFWLSDSMNPEGAVQIASTMSVPVETFDQYESQASDGHSLEAGQKYYFELRHKEGGWGDHFAVAWEGPGLSQQVVSGSYLHSYARELTAPEPDMAMEEAYSLGYRIGHFDAQQGLAFNPAYPPLDEDSDGLYDNWEVVYGLDPTDPADAASDTDGDLLSATEEFWAHSNPTVADTDGDGIPDGFEFAYGLDPTDPSDASRDLDGDGYSILEEYQAGTDPTDPDDAPVAEPEYLPGFIGQYFSGTGFDEFLYTQRDTSIAFNWGSGSPSEAVPNNRFSIRWSGWFTPPHEEGTREYEFTTLTDDGARLLLDGVRVIDQWKNQSPTAYSATATLPAGEPVGVTMEYYEFGYDAQASLTITDTESGQTLDTGSVIQSLDLGSETSDTVQTLNDGIPDTYKLRYGLPLLQPSANSVLNNAGVTVLEAYQSGLHPYTLAAVAEPLAPETQEPPPPEEDTTAEPGMAAATLSWTAPGTRVDGSSIALSEIAEYQIRYGQDPDNLDQSITAPADATSISVEGLNTGTWYFTIQVIDNSGLSSQPSDVVEYVVN